MVSFAPVVADPFVTVDDQRVDAELMQPRGTGKSCLSAADNNASRIAIGVGAPLGQAIAPVLGAEVAGRVRFYAAPEFLFMTSKLMQICVQRPGPQPALRVRRKPQHAVGGAEYCFELEQRLDRFGARARYPARRRPARRNVKIFR